MRIRAYRDGDLGQLVALWERSHVPDDPFLLDDLVELLVAPDAHTVVAEAEGRLVAAGLGAASGAVGIVHRLDGDGDAMPAVLEQLERRLAEDGARTCTVLVPRDGALRELAEGRGYSAGGGTVALRRPLDARSGELEELGGRTIDPDLWEQLEGMQDVKDVIERRIILPLAEPDLARRHGVSAPQSVVLFGPPGTGKTTFAKGVASRLRWPFVPVEVAQLAGDDRDDPRFLAETCDRLLAAPSAVTFFDEVEDIAADRQTARRVSPMVTNELLRQLPRFRASDDHLLVCATNSVGSLDPAFLRPGRFDYVVPVGPPNATARAAIWQRYVHGITDEDVDVEALVQASERFTPADIEFAARKAAQLAFEAEHAGTGGDRARTEDFLGAIRETRPTLTTEMIAAFERDVDEFARY